MAVIGMENSSINVANSSSVIKKVRRSSCVAGRRKHSISEHEDPAIFDPDVKFSII